jgi:AcrR family transcriptional regulator
LSKEQLDQAVRDAKLGVILDAAIEVFADKGYHATRLEDIAEKAGFSKASLYNYFENKDVIFLSLVNREHTRLLEGVRQKFDPQASWEQNLRAVFQLIFSLFGKHFAFILELSGFQMNQILQTPEFCKTHGELIESFRKSLTGIHEVFVKILAQARQQKHAHSTLTDDLLAQYIGNLVRGVLFHWKTTGVMGDINESTEHLLTFVKYGLAAK